MVLFSLQNIIEFYWITVHKDTMMNQALTFKSCSVSIAAHLVLMALSFMQEIKYKDSSEANYQPHSCLLPKQWGTALMCFEEEVWAQVQ